MTTRRARGEHRPATSDGFAEAPAAGLGLYVEGMTIPYSWIFR